MIKNLLLLFTLILCSQQTFSQVNCVGALALTPGTQQCGDSTGQPGDFPSDGSAPVNPCDANYNDDEYWFSYTAVTTDETLDLTLSGLTQTWAGLFMIDDCPSGSPSCLIDATNNSSTANLMGNSGPLVAGQDYYIVISNYGTPNNTAFCIDAVVNPPAPPLDYCGTDNFVDSGGTASNYASNENLNWTICPDVPTDKVTVRFLSFAVEDNGSGTCWDELYIYDGDDNTAPAIGPANGHCYDGVGTNGTGYPGGGLGVPITSSHATGCLHFNFTSDGSVTRAGWEAEVTCEAYTDPSTTVALAPPGTTTMTASNAHIGANGFTYYEDPAAPGNYLFAVDWNAAGNGRNDASDVTVTVDNAPADGTSDDGTFATWTMKRFWNVDMGTGTLADPVDVKFFYDGAEKTATETAASGDGRPLETPAWFKSPAGIAWNNAPQAGNPILDVIELTDANAGPGATENGVVFAEFTAVPSFSGGSFASGVGIAGASALPVEITSFKGVVMEDGNKLKWITASEENASHYEIERLIVDVNRWESIGKVDAIGNSNSEHDYQFMDDSPNNTNFYRLKMVDSDGQFEYSNTINLLRQISTNQITSIYPNPTNEILIADYVSTEENLISISIYDLNGKVVYQLDNYTVSKGESKITLDVQNLNMGVFMLHLNSNTNSQVIKFIKN